MTLALSESLEDYLEAIFHIVSAKQAARATDIRDRMGVNRSSVTGALQALADRGMVNYAPYDIITLTPAGTAAAEDIVQRHQVLRDFFSRVLAVDEAIADEAACGMEHHMGKAVLRRLGYLAEYITDGDGGDKDQWLLGFREFCGRRERETAPDAEPASP